ncbi:endonuclease SmrB [Pseudidiomarina sp.]|uniref:endonuclease SmrB n=1 Tax=Pseudidiomarina sp. TaxID=2081707 RepID=UPI003A975AF5
MSNDLDDDFALFREQVKVDRRIRSETYQAPRQQRRIRSQQKTEQRTRQQQAEFFFSDNFRAHFPEGPVRFCADGESSHILKQLRRGDFPPELLLDLHGMTQAVAKRELGALLRACVKQQIECCAVMSGHGKGILKENLPHWLVQHPAVRAFHQAPAAYGGNATLLVLLK